MTTLEILKRTRLMIRNEDYWWDGSPGATSKHCAVTALVGICGGVGKQAWERNHAACEALGMRAIEIMKFNDSHTHAEVLQLFDDAIARLEEHECPISDTSTSSRLSPVPA